MEEKAGHDRCNYLFLNLSNSVIANIHSICVNAILFFMRVCSSLKADCIISSSLERILFVYVFVLNLYLRARGPEVGKRKDRKMEEKAGHDRCDYLFLNQCIR